jgi:hypothetical protein
LRSIGCQLLKAVAGAVNRALVRAAIKGDIAEGEIDASVIPFDVAIVGGPYFTDTRGVLWQK